MKLLLPKDPLLLGAKVIVGFACGIMIFAMVMVGIGLGALATTERAELIAKLAEAGAPGWAVWVIGLALLLIIGALYAGARFTLELFGIIDTVGNGDPFEPENGNRLSRMGWLALAAQAIGVAVGAIALWLKPFADKAGENLDADFDLHFSGVLLVLILFILARVFREGARMRAELEGTV